MRRISTLVLVLALTSAGLYSPFRLFAQQTSRKKVLVINWYDRGFPANAAFEQQIRSALQAAAPDGTEYYSEYLDTNKFPRQASPTC